jgi:hypothetical protein
MTVKEFMEANLGVACVDLGNLIVGLSKENREPFYFYKRDGPFLFGFAYDRVQEMMLEELMPYNYTAERYSESLI